MMLYYSALCAALLLISPPAQAADKWALLVGVSDYLQGSSMDLKGPDNDVQMMEELLLTKFGYEPAHIRKLVDAEATKASIVGTIKTWLVKVARPGDTVVIYYSGHGSQVFDQEGDEPDGWDEVLCPADVNPGVPGNELSDDELSALLRQVQATDITVIFDACHSGTGARGLEFNAQPLQIRAIDLGYPVPAGKQRALSFEAEKGDGMDLPEEEPQGGTRSLEGGKKAFTMIASCAPSETSASTVFYEGLSSFWAGVLTYNLVNALKKADGGTSYEELIAGVVRDVKKCNRGQTPQAEGDVARSIFANTSQGMSTRNYIRVIGVEGKQVELQSSSWRRERAGSIYQVLSPETGQPAGWFKITEVRPSGIYGEILEGQGQIRASFLAVEEFHATSEERLQVRVGDFGDQSINQAMRSRLEKIDCVRVSPSDTDYAEVVVKGKIAGSVLSLLTGYEITAWLEEGGVRSREITSVNVDEIMGVLRPLLENAYAIKKLSRMDNDSPPFKVSVWATNIPNPGKKEAKFAEMKVGDPVYFHEESRWMPPSLLGGGKRARRRRVAVAFGGALW